MPRKQKLLIDFDGVLYRYEGWEKSNVLGKAVEGARGALYLLSDKYQLVCFTSRTNTEEVQAWLRRHGFPEMRVTHVKEPAHLIIDDRTICFEGSWTDELIKRITSFRPYWQALSADHLDKQDLAGAEGPAL